MVFVSCALLCQPVVFLVGLMRNAAADHFTWNASLEQHTYASECTYMWEAYTQNARPVPGAKLTIVVRILHSVSALWCMYILNSEFKLVHEIVRPIDKRTVDKDNATLSRL